jgi:hypothetical protein
MLKFAETFGLHQKARYLLVAKDRFLYNSFFNRNIAKLQGIFLLELIPT